MSLYINHQLVNVIVDTGSYQAVVFGKDNNICSTNCYTPSNNVLQNSSQAAVLITDDSESIIDSNALNIYETVQLDVNTYNQNKTNTVSYTNASLVYTQSLTVGAPQNSVALNVYPDNIDGIMGLGYAIEGSTPSNILNTTTWLTLIESYSIIPQQPIIALDYRADNTSYMNLGGMDVQYMNTIQWAQPIANPIYHEANLYNFNICNVNLLGAFNIVSWPAIVDTGSICLSLPAELFDMIIAWVPAIHCVDAVQPSNTTQTSETTLCYINTTSIQLLPTLSFSLCNNCVHKLYINLTELVLDDVNLIHAQYGNRICINRVNSMDDPSGDNFITIGSLVLYQLYFVSNMEYNIIGLAQKNDIQQASNVQCAIPIHCTGTQQQYYKQLNTCITPSCNSYFLFVYNSDSNGCVVSSSFNALAVTLLVIYVAGELGLLLWKQDMHYKILTSVPPS